MSKSYPLPSIDITTLIRNRRSIKPALMSDRPVEPHLLETLLENANWAPSHGLTEPWRFCIYKGTTRKELADNLQRISVRKSLKSWAHRRCRRPSL